MPMWDRRCESCGELKIDCWESLATPDFPCACGGVMKRAWVGGQGPKAHGDECDIYIKHAICNPDGSPKRYRSKTEIRKAQQKAGVVNAVRHIGSQGSDKSPHTTKWY